MTGTQPTCDSFKIQPTLQPRNDLYQGHKKPIGKAIPQIQVLMETRFGF